VESFWRRVPSVREAERSRFAFFFGVAVLVSLAQTLGLSGAEALFLARYGVAYLPHVFIAGSVVTVFGMLLYAALVGSVRNDKMFFHMLWIAALALGAAGYGAVSGVEFLFAGLLILYFLTQAIFLNHFWNFASDYFDILASKRLSHLFTIGASAGGILGGSLAVAVSRMASPETLIAGWALLLVATAAFIRLGRRVLIRWGLIDLVEKDETSLEGLASAIRYLRRSALGRWLVVSAVGMTMALFTAQYLYSEIFVATFPTARSLAAFFGIFLALSNLGELAVEFAVTPWLIRRFGVARANLVHPTLTLLSFVALAVDPRLQVAIVARLNREMLEEAFSATIRNLTYNAIAQRFRGRMRALIEGIVVYAAMAFAGIALLLSEGIEPLWLCAAGGGIVLLALIANLRIRDEYMHTLVGGVREGRLDLTQLQDQLASWDDTRLVDLWENLVGQGGPSVHNTLQLTTTLSARGLVEPLVLGASHENEHVRRACIEALSATPAGLPESVLIAAVADPDPGVRRAALEALVNRDAEPEAPPPTPDDRLEWELGGRRPPQRVRRSPRHSFAKQLEALLRDDDVQVRAETALAIGDAGLPALAEMARGEDVAAAVAALRCLPAELAEVARDRAQDPNPELRAAALEAVARLAGSAMIGREQLARDLDHGDPRVRSAAVSALAASAATGTVSLETIASALADPNHVVRKRAVAALQVLGEEGARAAVPYMRLESEGTAEATIDVLTPQPFARSLLVPEFRRRVSQAWGDLLALHALPKRGSISMRFLHAAHGDSVRRNQSVAFAILRAIEDPGVVGSIQRALRLGSPRARADALEVLSNLGDRKAVSLLVLMLEDSSIDDKVRSMGSIPDLGQAVDADRRALDVWIRMGAEYYRKDGDGDVSQRETMERLLLLRDVPLFSGLSLQQLEAINQIMNERQYMRGEVVFREGDPAGELYLMIEGKIRIVQHYGTDDESILNTLIAPAYFGEMAILDDKPRSATVVIIDDTRLLAVGGDSFKELMLQMPEISFEICRSLSTRVRALESAPEAGP
jgi:HEAT repeat protein